MTTVLRLKAAVRAAVVRGTASGRHQALDGGRLARPMSECASPAENVPQSTVPSHCRLACRLVAKGNFMNVRCIHPFAGLALNEIHESRGAAAVNLSVGMSRTHCVGTLLRK